MDHTLGDLILWLFVMVILFATSIVSGVNGQKIGFNKGFLAHQEQCVEAGVGKWVPVNGTSNNFEFVENVKE